MVYKCISWDSFLTLLCKKMDVTTVNICSAARASFHSVYETYIHAPSESPQAYYTYTL